jgi:hypothetical protein
MDKEHLLIDKVDFVNWAKARIRDTDTNPRLKSGVSEPIVTHDFSRGTRKANITRALAQ